MRSRLETLETDETAQKLATIVQDTKYDRLPQEVIIKAELFLLNGLGCMIAGRATQIGRGLMDFDRSLAEKERHWMDAAKPSPEQYKIYRDALAIFSTELTTVCLTGINHPDSVIIPVLMNMGQEEDRESAIEAIVAGTEVMSKIGILLNPDLYLKGWHSTGVCGVFGAAAVACKLLKRTRQETVYAFQLAAGLANSDYFKLDKTNPVIKVINPGIAAVSGSLSAVAAAATAATAVLAANTTKTAPKRYRPVLADTVDNFVGKFGGYSKSINWSRYEILDLFYKSMPVVCAFHAILEPLSDLIIRNKIDGASISKIKVNYHKIPSDYYSGHAVNSVYGAQTSLPYSAAILAKRHRISINEFTDDIVRDPEVQQIAGSVEIVPSHLQGTGDDLIKGEIELIITSGKRYRAKVEKAVGCPPENIPDKFFQLTKFAGLDEKAAREFYGKIISKKDYRLKELKI